MSWALLLLAFGGPLVSPAHAEGEAELPVLNGQSYERWQLLASARNDVVSRGKAGVVLSCRYLGDFAQKDASWDLQLKVVRRDHLVPKDVAAKLGLVDGKPVNTGVDTPVNALCPVPPNAQDAGWSPALPSAADVAAQGAKLLPQPKLGGREELIAVDLSAGALHKNKGRCDDKAHTLEALFYGKRAAHLNFCTALVEKEFDRGMKRCLGMVNQTLNRVYSKDFDPGRMEFMSWGKSDPTPSYCASLLMLAGPAFDESLRRGYTCETPFEALGTTDFTLDQRWVEDAVLGVFGSTAVRVLPVLKTIQKECGRN